MVHAEMTSDLNETVQIGNLFIDRDFHRFIDNEVMPGLETESAVFWPGLESLIDKYVPLNEDLLQKRVQLQEELDRWNREHRDVTPRFDDYLDKLFGIGYLAEKGGDFSITTAGVDPEISRQCGPQLVVPLSNIRYAINAANARWGSLYDALYGTDVIDSIGDNIVDKQGLDPERAAKVVDWARDFLDETFPLDGISHSDVAEYCITDGKLAAVSGNKSIHRLVDTCVFAGYRGDADRPQTVLLVNNGLHVEISIDRDSAVGSSDPAGVSDIILESALTTIMDCEDSVSAVDCEDKINVYRNWLALTKGDAEADFEKNGRTIKRRLRNDGTYIAPGGGEFTLKGRGLMLIRNNGLLTRIPLIRDRQGQAVPEGIMDGIVTSLIAIHDLKGSTRYRNSGAGSIYIVKPKLHGPEEVRYVCSFFSDLERFLGLPENTLKLGLMDEERRTSVNLKECIRAASGRIFFINTGFLDRTGDEIHTNMHAGPMIRKDEMKRSSWYTAYERHNVCTGLECGFRDRVQIGKGMWPMPDKMKDMLEQKVEHLKAGANTAWVPSPTAATLHALHYHHVDVNEVQENTGLESDALNREMYISPLVNRDRELTREEITSELKNNIQGILGYVSKWVMEGDGCSKIANIDGIGLMEDRATLRISSQLVANWLLHGICDEDEVIAILTELAKTMWKENRGSSLYEGLAQNPASHPAFQASRELMLEGINQPNGYTELILFKYRRSVKEQSSS